MAIAALYDIHGNLPALKAVLSELDDLDINELIIGGDLVLGPMPSECFDLLLSLDLPIHYIRGNCEDWVLGSPNNKPPVSLPKPVLKNIAWCNQQLSAAQKQLIEHWPLTHSIQTQSLGYLLFCHATPKDNMPIFTRRTSPERIAELFSGIDAQIAVCGHTHMQFDMTLDNLRIVNSGSVGMPFGEPGAYWLLIDDAVHLKRTKYNFRKAADTIKSTNYPQALGFAEQHVLDPPTEEEMLNRFSRA